MGSAHEHVPTPVLVERIVTPAVVRRVIRRHRGVGGFGREVPHEHGYSLPVAELDPRDRAVLDVHADVVRLLTRDDPRLRLELATFEAWEALRRDGALPESAIRERMHRVGQAEIDEVRAVLRAQRRLLPPRAGDGRNGVMWSLFAAYWVELRTYDPERLVHDLPTLAARHDEIDRLLAADVPWSIPQDAALDRAAPPTLVPPPEPVATAPTPALTLLGERLTQTVGGQGWAAAIAAAVPPEPRWFSLERRLLHDLRKACIDAERPIVRGDVLRFVTTLGRSPLVRALPHLGPLRVVRHLAKARARTRHAALGALLDAVITTHEQRLRTALRPHLHDALARATRGADSVVEAVSRAKAIEELLDRIIAKGRLDFPTLRDSVSRNHAKLADLGARDLVHDRLLDADKSLARHLDGVHRRGEIYRRGLHRVSALAFGTPVGRALTRFALVPIIGAYAVIETLQHTLGLLVPMHLLQPLPFALIALTILGLVNSARVRHIARTTLRTIGRGLHATFVRLPRWLWRRPFFATPGWRLLARWVLEPALLAAPFAIPILLFVDLPPPWPWVLAAIPLALAIAIVNSALGLRLEEATTDAIVRTRRYLGEDLIPGLIAWLIAVFKALLDVFERVLYAIDERLRARAGTPRRWVVLLAFVALPWRVVAYIARLYVNLSLEPKVNPVKHFPAVTIGHKLIVPLSLALSTSLEPSLGAATANTIAATVLFVVPGLFGFLAWELKENWRLYATNRPRTLRPAIVGSHGETFRALLRPGFHSGTLPKLFGKLRRTLQRPPGPARERALVTLTDKLHHVEHDVTTYFERDVLALAAHAGMHLHVAHIELASNRIRVHLADGTSTQSDGLALGGRSVFVIEAQSGHIVGAFTPAPTTPATQLMVAGLHRTAAVDLIRDRLAAHVAHAPYDIDERGLVVWPGPGYTHERIEPLTTLATPTIRWPDWVAAWSAATRPPADGRVAPRPRC